MEVFEVISIEEPGGRGCGQELRPGLTWAAPGQQLPWTGHASSSVNEALMQWLPVAILPLPWAEQTLPPLGKHTSQGGPTLPLPLPLLTSRPLPSPPYLRPAPLRHRLSGFPIPTAPCLSLLGPQGPLLHPPKSLPTGPGLPSCHYFGHFYIYPECPSRTGTPQVLSSHLLSCVNHLFPEWHPVIRHKYMCYI